MSHIQLIQTILYVADQTASCAFYRQLLRQTPSLNVPGITEFTLSPTCKLGLMPNKAIAQILGDQVPHPDTGTGIPRCELYLYVDDVDLEYKNALHVGAKLISPLQERSWGDRACYFSDLDGHIIAFAQKRGTAS